MNDSNNSENKSKSGNGMFINTSNTSNVGVWNGFNNSLLNLKNDASIQSSTNEKNENSTNNQINAMEKQDIEKKHSNTTDDLVTNQQLVEAFIGKKYDKITRSFFNLAGFLFTTFYMFYRKMILYGIISTLLLSVALYFFKSPITLLVYSLVVGLSVNNFYVSFAERKVAKIRRKKSKKSIEQLKIICSKKGGTSIISIILGTLFQVITELTIIILLIIAGLSKVTNNFFQINTFINSTLNKTFNGIFIPDTSVKISNNFTSITPQNFKDLSNKYQYKYEYTYGDLEHEKCTVTLYSLKGFNNAEKLVNQMTKYYNKDGSTAVENININNINWYWFSLEDVFEKNYYYGTTKKNKTFLLKYQINKRTANDCESYTQLILNSINSK